MNSPHRFSIVPAERKHVPAIHAMIRELAQYEKLEHLLSGTVENLEGELFGERPVIEAVTALVGEVPAAFAGSDMRQRHSDGAEVQRYLTAR